MTEIIPPVPLLACKGVGKRFGPVIANRGIDLEVYPGQILAILGENGAGKSTLMSVIAGRYRPDEGELEVEGKAVSFSSPSQALSQGIGMVYQRFMLIDSLTVAENILLAADASGKSVSIEGIRREILSLGARYGLEVQPDCKVRELSMGERQRTEILKLLVQSVKVLIFDEPTAVLAQPDVEGFFSVLQKLKADGRGILFITHKLEEVLAVADRIAILRKGRIIAQTTPDRIGSKNDLARLMVGREVVLRLEKPPVPVEEVVLEVSGLTGPSAKKRPDYQDIAFSVRRGEIFSIVGVAGNGQKALCEALNSQAQPADGTIRFQNRRYTAKEWAGRQFPEIAYVPEDRHYTGSIADMDLAENFLLTHLDLSADSFWLNRRKMTENIDRAVKEYGIVAHDTGVKAGQLSGGNLQKLILARELAGKPALFIAEQPTQGLDITATEDVWHAILAQRQTSAVILFTSDLKEALALSDRIAVMFAGRILESIDTADAESVGRIGLLMAGVVN